MKVKDSKGQLYIIENGTYRKVYETPDGQTFYDVRPKNGKSARRQRVKKRREERQ